jgi:FkbM family methyltransferase
MIFTKDLLKELRKNRKKEADRWVEFNYGNKPKKPTKLTWKIKFYLRMFFYRTAPFDWMVIKTSLLNDKSKINYFKYLFNLLEHDECKELLIEVLCLRLLSYDYVRLKINDENFWVELETLNKKMIESRSDGLDEFAIDYQGLPLFVIGNLKSVFNQFHLKQYELIRNNIFFGAKSGDYCIDGGACWGETSLFFSRIVGVKGKVYAFEFIPSNMSVLKEVLAKNSDVTNVEIIENPIWNKDNVEIYYKDKGSGSRVTTKPFENFDGIVRTKTIDTLVSENIIQKVDLIKLDVEGAELNALKGAVESIKKFKPLLIVALYHYERDFKEIPEFIQNLRLGYKFYFGHYTNYHEESFLYAVPIN